MSAGFAAADVAVSGSAKMGVVSAYNITKAKNEATFKNKVVISFSGSGTTDGGLAFGGKVDADDAIAAEAAGTSGSVFISGAFGKITMGSVASGDSAAVGQLASVGYNGLGSGNSIGYAADGGGFGGLPGSSLDATAARVLYTYSAGALTLNASSAQLTANGATSYGIGGSYAAGALTVGLGYGIVDGATVTGLKAWDVVGTVGQAAANSTTLATAVLVAVTPAGYYETKALDASVTDVSLSAAYVMDNTTIKAIYQQKTVEASATARTDADQAINISVAVAGVTPTALTPIVTAAVHGHDAISLKSTATSMGLSVSQKMDALTLTAYGINTTIDADSDLSADNPTVSRYGIGFAYNLGGGATVAGGYAAVDAMTPTAIAGVAAGLSGATAQNAFEKYTLTSVTRNTFDLGINFAF
jgi:outer membrane protein OmpU